MNEPAPARIGDALDWLHEQGKRRSEAVPECDVEETLLIVSIVEQFHAPGQDQGKPGVGTGSSAFGAAPEADGGTGGTVNSGSEGQLELTHRVEADGSAAIHVRGELCIATADQAYGYLRDVVDNQLGPVTINLAELDFCDAAGLGVLARVAGHARRSNRPIRIKGMRPSLVRIMRITGVDEMFPEISSGSGLTMIRWPQKTDSPSHG